MKTATHDALIQIDGNLYFADGNFSSFDLKFVNGSNIDLVGYSGSLKELFIRFNNQKTYIYKDVNHEVYDDMVSSETKSIGTFMTHRVKGFFRYEEIFWGLHKASLTDVCNHYRTMQYNLDTMIGCWATDASTIVTALIGADKFEELFWQLEYIAIPDNCQRIK
jgi:KTSC domain-containing protein